MAQPRKGLTPEGHCDRCSNINFDTEYPPCSSKYIYILHRTRESHQKSLRDGCKFCLLLSSQLGSTGFGDDECNELNAYIVLQSRLRKGQRSIDTINVVSQLWNCRLTVVGEIPDKYRKAAEEAGSTTNRKRKRGQSGGGIDPLVPRDDEHGTTGSEANMRLAALWIQDCLQNHDECKRGASLHNEARLPARLLNIHDPQNPFIVDTPHDSPAPYVALSYSWGPVKVLKTTSANYEEHTKRIPPDRLARTIQDAIKSAHALGFSYIWIDALCIIQDDQRDLNSELPHMGNVYRRANLTLYAEGSRSSQDGLFRPRDPRTLHPCAVRVTLPADNEKPSLCLTVTLKTIAATTDHLSTRGWVLQEEISTSRCLMFGEKQMRWRCMQAFADETGLCPVPKPGSGKAANVDTKLSPEDKMRMLLFHSSEGLHKITPERKFRSSVTDPCDVWYRIVERYGTRDLTKDKDTLPAVSGLAKLFQEAMKNSEETRDQLVDGRYAYAQGLWKGDLAVGLSWYVEVDDRVIGSRRATKGQGERIATWSWASVGKVDIRFRGWNKYYESCEDLAVKVTRVDCVLEDQHNPYGPAKLGTLRLEARLRRVKIQDPAGYSEDDPRFRNYAARGEHARFSAIVVDSEDPTMILGEAALDTCLDPCLEPDVRRLGLGRGGTESSSAADRFEIDVWCMLLHIQKPNPPSYLEPGLSRATGMVLQQAGGGKYCRLGLFFPVDSPYEEMKSLFPIGKTIEIV